MRQALTKTRLVVAALAVATTTAVLAWHPWHHPVPPAQNAVLTYTQDAKGVHVRIHNPNAHWGLRDQPARILLLTKGGAPINVYGPDMDTTDYSSPGVEFHCCTITYLGPHGDYTFDLLPTKPVVGGVDIKLRGGQYWVRM